MGKKSAYLDVQICSVAYVNLRGPRKQVCRAEALIEALHIHNNPGNRRTGDPMKYVPLLLTLATCAPEFEADAAFDTGASTEEDPREVEPEPDVTP